MNNDKINNDKRQRDDQQTMEEPSTHKQKLSDDEDDPNSE